MITVFFEEGIIYQIILKAMVIPIEIIRESTDRKASP